jgi:branched-chain amino acid aminotransferase
MTAEIAVERTARSRRADVDFNNLGFGNYISDHMLVADFRKGQWRTPAIQPFGEIGMTPAIMALHYGQAIFEGMKAFRMKNGNLNIFRPHRHHQRLLRSLERMCMPPVPESLFMESLEALIRTDADWVPQQEDCSLYIRPVVFATESRLGVRVSEEYKFVVLTSPVGPYFAKPIRVKVETHFVRAAEGGTGFAKCAGNYGGAFYPTALARSEGFDQVLWTDAQSHDYIDESGAMNVMFVINGKLVTPLLTSAILDGVTRDSILTLAKDLDVPTEQKRISVAELEQAFKSKTITEAFGVGTAAVVSTINEIHIRGIGYRLPEATAASFHLRVKKMLGDIRTGAAPDVHGWNHILQ